MMLFPYVQNYKKFNPKKSSVYYAGPYWDWKEIISAFRCLLFGKWLSSGENVRQFEEEFCKKFRQSAAVMVNSGSSANLVALAALKKVKEWKDGDEIIVSTVGFPTTVAPVVVNGFTPVFVDIEMKTLNLDLNLVERSITPKTRAIFLSPVLGNPPDMYRVFDICHRKKIELILDNCDSLGTKFFGRNLSEYAACSTHSFYPAHHISTGEGGMVTSKSKELIKIARSISWWGRDCVCVGQENLFRAGKCGKRFSNWLKPYYSSRIDHKYFFTELGYNLRPLDLQGAIGIEQLKKFDEIHKGRKRSKHIIGRTFDKYLRKHLHTIQEGPNASVLDVSWFATPIICMKEIVKQSLVQHLEKNRIQTRNVFSGNLLLHPAYSHLGDWRKYPNANEVLKRVFFVGASPNYNERVFKYIETTVKEFRI